MITLFGPPEPTLLERLKESVGKTREVLTMPLGELLAGGKKIFTMPKIGCIRGMVLNHVIHHRAQLTVYYRLLDIPVPGLYGPSADETTPTAASAS